MEPCRICTLIGQTVSSDVPFDDIELGTYEELQRSAESCSTCRDITSYVIEDEQEPLTPETLICLHKEFQPDNGFFIYDEKQLSLVLSLLPLDRKEVGRSVGVLLDEQWIDLQRIRTWVTYCDKEHQCPSLAEHLDIRPADKLLFVDVIEGCLVPAPGASRQRGQLRDIDLPETIRDAMRLVQSLGERYLWVDRFCIIQDDFEHKRAQIDMMGSIYANSYCTIIAADGKDSHQGLRGIGSGSTARDYKQHILGFQQNRCVVLGDTRLAERKSVWNRRGWTYQEKIMSPRALIFLDNRVSWRCQRCLWREDMTAEPEGAVRPEVGQMFNEILIPYRWPNLVQWINIISSYNGRNLTYESDRLSALAGVESILRPSFPGGFCNGLPEFFFDAAILWQLHSPMRRRNTYNISSMKDYLPTWSWIGWHGPIDTQQSHGLGIDYIRFYPANQTEWIEFRTSCVILPLVKWYQIDTTGNRREIRNDYHRWRAKSNIDHTLPSGWRRHEDDAKRMWFDHPAEEKATFWWPVPMELDSPQTTSQFRSLPPYLSFRSTRTYFKVEKAIPGLYLRGCVCVSLHDIEGTWAGVLRLNLGNTNDAPLGELYELVAVSMGEADNSVDESRFFEEWNLEERPRTSRLYQFYNVLHVEREDDWILRKSIGRIEKAAWERHKVDL
ncbi:HET-domain-containing protein [Zopfia rhizophila CBS 207.26]|uniref:HET-domain-containing protein n=1 Tax=Zopfia rhizophila CBS 207.26 TaxID=1314779 RepID=A0A6A6DFV9_9PEZI|nr:HET-domain-containing protein [Zopfia rhizophila CBS 207.26]